MASQLPGLGQKWWGFAHPCETPAGFRAANISFGQIFPFTCPSPGTQRCWGITCSAAQAPSWYGQNLVLVGAQPNSSKLSVAGEQFWPQATRREEGWVETSVLFVKFNQGFPRDCYRRKVLAYELFNINSGTVVSLLTVWLLQRFL